MILLVPLFALILLLGIPFLPRKILGWCIIVGFAIFPLYNYFLLKNCSGDCSIRIDLVIIIPLFLFMIIVWSIKKYLHKN